MELDMRLLVTYHRGCESFGNACCLIMEHYDGEKTKEIERETAIIDIALARIKSLAPSSGEHKDLLGKRQAIKEALETSYRFGVFDGWMDMECARQSRLGAQY